jgi:RNA recognition motif-containing protein
MNIFVGNLSYDAGEKDLIGLFAAFGEVESAAIMVRRDRDAISSRGFGFVRMPDESQAQAAVAALNGQEFMGRALVVNPARPGAEELVERTFRDKRQPGPILNSPGKYRGGRRTRSFLRKQGIEPVPAEAHPRRKSRIKPPGGSRR